MIGKLAFLLGGDERALRLARKLVRLHRYLNPFELRHWLQLIEEIIAERVNGSRAA